ncbi:hypothetical protein JTE90_016714 [Oedothorax gibbosus]|uniref:Uncharacterized protein n=1 Tax=Oedothorax gibbosus TaxID=931172 RepID=A0AAV6V1H7_9ARAC|nr:hypothetical protein JTE90_016714 [Oedothorax gibbosus]
METAFVPFSPRMVMDWNCGGFFPHPKDAEEDARGDPSLTLLSVERVRYVLFVLKLLNGITCRFVLQLPVRDCETYMVLPKWVVLPMALLSPFAAPPVNDHPYSSLATPSGFQGVFSDTPPPPLVKAIQIAAGSTGL